MVVRNYRAFAAAILVVTSVLIDGSNAAHAGEPNFARRLWTKVRPEKSQSESVPNGSPSNSGNANRSQPLLTAAGKRDRHVPDLPPSPPPMADLDDVQPVQFEQAGASSWSLSQLEQAGIENNPSVSEAAAIVEKARGEYVQAGLYPNPVFGYQASEVGNDGRAGQQGLFVGQEFVTAGKLRLAENVAANDVQRLNWQYQTQLKRVQTDVRLRFYETLGAQREVDITAELRQVAQESVEAGESREKSGESSQSDVLQLELDLNQILITQQNAERKLDAAKRRLKYVIGQPELPDMFLIGELDGQSTSRAFSDEWARLSQSPILQAAAWRITRASALVRREQAQPIPNVDVQGGVQYDNATEYTIANLQVGVALPIHNKNQGNIRAAVAEYQQALNAQDRLELKLRDQLAEALRVYDTALYQVNQYRTVIVPKSEQNLNLTTEGWNAANLGNDDGFLKLVIARRTFYEAKLAYVRAQTELRVAEATLDGLQLTGGLDAPND